MRPSDGKMIAGLARLVDLRNLCGEHALAFEPYNASELVVPDKEEIERKKRQAEQKAEVEKLKKQGMEQLKRGLDFLDSLNLGGDDED